MYIYIYIFVSFWGEGSWFWVVAHQSCKKMSGSFRVLCSQQHQAIKSHSDAYKSNSSEQAPMKCLSTSDMDSKIVDLAVQPSEKHFNHRSRNHRSRNLRWNNAVGPGRATSRRCRHRVPQGRDVAVRRTAPLPSTILPFCWIGGVQVQDPSRPRSIPSKSNFLDFFFQALEVKELPGVMKRPQVYQGRRNHMSIPFVWGFNWDLHPESSVRNFFSSCIKGHYWYRILGCRWEPRQASCSDSASQYGTVMSGAATSRRCGTAGRRRTQGRLMVQPAFCTINTFALLLDRWYIFSRSGTYGKLLQTFARHRVHCRALVHVGLVVSGDAGRFAVGSRDSTWSSVQNNLGKVTWVSLGRVNTFCVSAAIFLSTVWKDFGRCCGNMLFKCVLRWMAMRQISQWWWGVSTSWLVVNIVPPKNHPNL